MLRPSYRIIAAGEILIPGCAWVSLSAITSAGVTVRLYRRSTVPTVCGAEDLRCQCGAVCGVQGLQGAGTRLRSRGNECLRSRGAPHWLAHHHIHHRRTSRGVAVGPDNSFHPQHGQGGAHHLEVVKEVGQVSVGAEKTGLLLLPWEVAIGKSQWRQVLSWSLASFGVSRSQRYPALFGTRPRFGQVACCPGTSNTSTSSFAIGRSP